MNAVDYFSNKYSGIAPKNSNLTKAKAAKNDEFYTQYSDIEAELSHYEVKHFADRVVYLPCDDWHFSQFVKYFENNFTRLQLRALVATGINFSGAGYYYKKTSEGVTTGVLEGNGDFRSDACRQLMHEADIIVTNPPFSLFREFIAQIMEMRKQFLVIGNKNAITFKEFFPLLRENKVWLGANQSTIKYFGTPDGELSSEQNGLTRWFTNLDHKYHNRPMQSLIKDGIVRVGTVYSPDKYPKYVNYDGIEVSKVAEIPLDYFDKMGVPITFLQYYNSDEWEIVGNSLESCEKMSKIAAKGEYSQGGLRPYIKQQNGDYKYKRLYDRIFIKRKTIPVEPE